ncbi:hypothetical protein MRX96_054333 [Rhipicephalus microplus]
MEPAKNKWASRNMELVALNSEVEALMTEDLAAGDYEVVMQYDDSANSTLALLEHHIDVVKTYATPAWSTTSSMGARSYEGAPNAHKRLPQSEQSSADRWKIVEGDDGKDKGPEQVRPPTRSITFGNETLVMFRLGRLIETPGSIATDVRGFHEVHIFRRLSWFFVLALAMVYVFVELLGMLVLSS